MPILANAKKALRGSKRKAVYNLAVRSRAKSAVDALRKKPSMETLSAAYRAIDKAVKRNLYQANRAARLKSQLAKLVKPSKMVAKPVKAKTAKKVVKKTAKKTPANKTVKKTAKKAPAKKAASPKKKVAKK
jgi:ribosomal protein S20